MNSTAQNAARPIDSGREPRRLAYRLAQAVVRTTISTEVEADPDYRDAIGAVQDEGLASPSDSIAGTTNPLRIECLTTS